MRYRLAPPLPPGQQEGNAAEAIREAEDDLSHQNSATAQLDLQVISAILNAHLSSMKGKDALNRLQQEVESAVLTRTDLDTPAGARAFQSFLIDKLRDIRRVVEGAGLDATSKAALVAALASLYSAKTSTEEDPAEPSDPSDPGDATSPADQSAPAGDSTQSVDLGPDPLLEQLLAEDPGLLADARPAPSPAAQPPIAQPAPSFPGAGGAPGPMLGTGLPGGFPLSGLQGRGREPAPDWGSDNEAVLGSLDELFGEPHSSRDSSPDSDGEQPDDKEAGSAVPQPVPVDGPTEVRLPGGETVTAPNRQIASVIEAAAGGMPIPDAFHQQGIVIPPPGTAVSHPIDASRLTPGDIGMFTDRQALALGHSKALLNGQIQSVSSINGPSFLGWEHPPAPGAPTSLTSPMTNESPTPTRPAAAGPSR